jgi:hypothetical protein
MELHYCSLLRSCHLNLKFGIALLFEMQFAPHYAFPTNYLFYRDAPGMGVEASTAVVSSFSSTTFHFEASTDCLE